MTIQEDLNMENIIKILSDLGIEVPEDKQAELNKAVAKNYKTVVEFENKVNKLTEERDTAVETLKGFEGKDFDAITKERDEWKRKHDENEEKHRKEQEEREYNADLEAAATAAKCRDLKALTAHLNHDALRKSRNRKADMETAINAQREERGYLFEDEGGAARFDNPKKGGNPGGTITMKEIMAIKDPVERQKKIGQNLSLFGRKGE